MNSDPASLENLRDIVEPPPVPWWPPALGWWIVFSVLAVAAIVIAFRVWQAWRTNAYRRAALRELQATTSVAEIAEILKRTALVAYPRTEVASISGSAWCEWLGHTVGQKVPPHVADALTRGVFADSEGVNGADVLAFARGWIRRHKMAESNGRKKCL